MRTGMAGFHQRGRRRGAGRAVATPPLAFESMPPDPPRRGPAMDAPFLTRPPSSQLAPTPLSMILLLSSSECTTIFHFLSGLSLANCDTLLVPTDE